MNYNNVLRKIRPSKEDSDKIKEFSDALLKEAEKIGKTFSAKPLLCGSVVKNTWLSYKHDIDLFFLFSPMVSSDKLQDYGLEIGKELIKIFNEKYKISYAQHPYVTGSVVYEGEKYNIDIVPCYNISDPSKLKSAVDRTPFHVRYILKNLKFPDEVRLLKQFCHAQNVYGADVKTEGFSGYLCELLIINYGTFDNTIKNIAKWRAGQLIDICDHAKKKFTDPLVVIDPVDPNRNVASPVSVKTFYRLVHAAKRFIDNPSEKMFFKENVKAYSKNEILKKMKNRGTKWYAIEFKKPNIVDDTLYPQMRKAVKTIERLVEENGFKIMKNDFFCNDKCVILLESEVWEIPKVYKHVGPHVFSNHAEEFLKHYKQKNIFIENENWVLENIREHTLISNLLKKILKLKESDLKKIGMPSKISPLIRKGRIYSDKEIQKIMTDDFRIFMTDWFNRDIDIV